MFIREAAEFVGLTIPQFRAYVGKKVRYEKSGVENYCDYNDSDLIKLKKFLKIIEEYKNGIFDTKIDEEVYSLYKDEIDEKYVLCLVKYRKVFTLDEYIKYKDLFDKKRDIRIQVPCKICKNMNNINIRKIKQLNIEDIKENSNYRCDACNAHKKATYFWDDFIKNRHNFYENSKNIIEFDCKICGKKSKLMAGQFISRKYGGDLPICKHCIKGYVSTLDVWRKNNRDASIKFDKTKIPKEKIIKWDFYIENKDSFSNSDRRFIEFTCKECGKTDYISIIKMKARGHYKDTSICKICAAKKIFTDKMINDEDFRKKSMGHTNKLCGLYNEIRFDSSWELSVINYFGKNIKRCDISIQYEVNGEIHNYFPDFEVNLNNKKYLVEVKGRYGDRDQIKIDAAKNVIKNGLIDYDYMMIIDGRNIDKFNGMIIFDRISKLKLLNEDKLIITNYPDSFLKE